MRPDKPVYQISALLWIFLSIQLIGSYAVSNNIRSINLSAPGTFVDSIFDEFGSNSSMNLNQFSMLLRELKIGSSSKEQTNEGGDSKVRAY